MARYCLIGEGACSTQSLETSSGSFQRDQRLHHSRWRALEGFNGRGLWLCVASCKENINNVHAKLQMHRPGENTHKRGHVVILKNEPS